MDALPSELIKLCRLASLAECGDHFWAGVPALGLWDAIWKPAKRWAAGSRILAGEILTEGRQQDLQAIG